MFTKATLMYRLRVNATSVPLSAQSNTTIITEKKLSPNGNFQNGIHTQHIQLGTGKGYKFKLKFYLQTTESFEEYDDDICDVSTESFLPFLYGQEEPFDEKLLEFITLSSTWEIRHSIIEMWRSQAACLFRYNFLPPRSDHQRTRSETI